MGVTPRRNTHRTFAVPRTNFGKKRSWAAITCALAKQLARAPLSLAAGPCTCNSVEGQIAQLVWGLHDAPQNNFDFGAGAAVADLGATGCQPLMKGLRSPWNATIRRKTKCVAKGK